MANDGDERAASFAFVQSTQAETDTVAGKAAYQQSCGRCHGAAWTDGVFGPPLRGNGFLTHWSGRPVVDLLMNAHCFTQTVNSLF